MKYYHLLAWMILAIVVTDLVGTNTVVEKSGGEKKNSWGILKYFECLIIPSNNNKNPEFIYQLSPFVITGQVVDSSINNRSQLENRIMHLIDSKLDDFGEPRLAPDLNLWSKNYEFVT